MKSFVSLVILVVAVLTSSAFPQKLGKHTIEEWKTIIDTTWGEGLSTEEKLEIFDIFWNAVDDGYAGFNNLEVDWQGLYDLYRPEVAEGVSRGRFYGIISNLYLALQEAHTKVLDLGVYDSDLKPGIPLLVYQSGYYYNDHGHFGAGLSPLPDSSLLVYKVIDNHPLGLEPGDIVLGYDGTPWKDIYHDLLDLQFPIKSITEPAASHFGIYTFGGSSVASSEHIWLTSAGLNWHLFDTINVVKYGTNDTLHLSTDVLSNLDTQLLCTEQLPVPGVPMPDMSQTDNSWITWGVVEGTQIGYIYTSSWLEILGDMAVFQNAVNRLIDDFQITGLILDTRFNTGGQQDEANGGFSRLFNFSLAELNFAERSDPDDHFAMQKVNSRCRGETWRFKADNYLYDKPIAVLTGPLCWSAGDYNAMRLKFHPMTRFFGKQTNTAYVCFESFANINFSQDGWYGQYAPTNAYLLDNPGNYLTHVGFDVDEEVWLTQEDVANGEDTVVKRAIQWIQNLAYAHDVSVDKSYIGPSSGNVEISAKVKNSNNHEISVLAYLSNDSSVIDSVYLSESDVNWSVQWSVGEGENMYRVSVKTNDADARTSRMIPNIAWFTTKGPISVDHYEITSTDTIINPGDKPQINVYLKNNGKTATINNIVVKLNAIDTCATPNPSGISRRIASLAVGEINTHYSTFTISLDSACSGMMPVRVDIYEGGYLFWVDTLYINVIPTRILDSETNLPKKFALFQNYPNPFNPKTVICYALPVTCHLDLTIYNVLGQKVATLVNKKQPAGSYQIKWNASGFASGIYIYQLTAKGQTQNAVFTKKLILLR